MASLAEIARAKTELEPAQVGHLQRLSRRGTCWPTSASPTCCCSCPIDANGDRLVVLGQVRPSTSQTLYRSDCSVSAHERDRAATGRRRSMRLGEIIEGEITVAVDRERVRVLCIPVRWHGEIIAVLSRESAPSVGRQPGELERTYSTIFHRFARMIAAGSSRSRPRTARARRRRGSVTA